VHGPVARAELEPLSLAAHGTGRAWSRGSCDAAASAGLDRNEFPGDRASAAGALAPARRAAVARHLEPALPVRQARQEGLLLLAVREVRALADRARENRRPSPVQH